MEPYLAAALQLKSGPNLDQNLDSASVLVESAAREGAVLVGLPENFAFLGEDEEKVRLASRIAEASESFLEQTARRFNVTLLGGGYPVPAAPGFVYNTARLVDPRGRVLAEYRKLHLFDVDLGEAGSFRESATVKAGSELPPVLGCRDLGRLGVSICYDLRFPELYRSLASRGAEVVLVPSAFTEFTGRAHWVTLLRARAIENTCYVVAPAQVGRHSGKRVSFGHAMIVDPWGEVLADAGEQPGVVVAEISRERLDGVRRQMPSLSHRQIF